MNNEPTRTRKKDWVVATDLDGTLLDQDYPLREAARAIDEIAQGHRAIVCLATSKTLAELRVLADYCESDPLLVFENGAGYASRRPLMHEAGMTTGSYHGYHFVSSGWPYDALRELLCSLRERHGYSFTGFGDSSMLEIANLTRLPPVLATLACQRLATEPITWFGNMAELAQFNQELAPHGYHTIRGGRFLHVMPDVSKASAIRKALAAAGVSSDVPILACGDAPNDLEMLHMADLAVVFPDGQGGHLLPESPSTHLAPAPGPQAWLHIVTNLLSAADAPQNSLKHCTELS